MEKTVQDHIIAAIHVTDRVQQAGKVQEVLTCYGTYIKTRLGLHEATGNTVSPNGLILLELVGSSTDAENLLADLNRIEGVEAQSIVFGH